jgi:hypothetical protein
MMGKVTKFKFPIMITLRRMPNFTTKPKCKEHQNYFTKNRCLFLAVADPSPLTLPNYNGVAAKLPPKVGEQDATQMPYYIYLLHLFNNT